LGVEAVDNDSDSLDGVIDAPGNVPVAQPAVGAQDGAGVAAVNRVGVLPLEALRFPLFVST
jgi:phosphoribosylcarboxyaminoimidazole (NCAIR) mutase